jgi:hypothetical protein
MSQSDYIKFIGTATLLSNQTENLPKILSQNDYVSYEQYALETSLINTKISFSRLLPQNKSITPSIGNVYLNTDPTRVKIFDMEKKVSTCPNFILCKNTNNRPNRLVLNSPGLPIPGPINLDVYYKKQGYSL